VAAAQTVRQLTFQNFFGFCFDLFFLLLFLVARELFLWFPCKANKTEFQVMLNIPGIYLTEVPQDITGCM